MPSKLDTYIRNIAEVPWEEPPGHHGGSYSKMLVRPETMGSRRIDHRISCYQPKAYVEAHAHKVQEQIYHVLDGEGLMEIEGERQRRAPPRRDFSAARGRARDPQHRPRRSDLFGDHLAARRRIGAPWQRESHPHASRP